MSEPQRVPGPPRPRRPGSTDVARLAGVSQKTVSRVFNDQPYVAEAAEIAHDEIEKRLGEPAPETRARPRTVEKSPDRP